MSPMMGGMAELISIKYVQNLPQRVNGNVPVCPDA
jgi:hypothetical protein